MSSLKFLGLEGGCQKKSFSSLQFQNDGSKTADMFFFLMDTWDFLWPKNLPDET